MKLERAVIISDEKIKKYLLQPKKEMINQNGLQ
jgi:hypothetical protein